MQALNRLSVEEFRLSSKLPVVLVLDNVRSGLNVVPSFGRDAFAFKKSCFAGSPRNRPTGKS